MASSSQTTRTLVIGSRGSQLALWQARHVAARLEAVGIATRVEIISTTGDHLQTASLVQAGGKGLFTKEIEEALLDGTIDIAVHSLKDLPTQIPVGLAIAAIPQREDARDAIVGQRLEDLPEGARVGTSSRRRVAQLRALRPDLNVEAIRGNVDTRIRKLRQRQYEAVVLAAAGLRRLGLENEIAETFSTEQICPAPGQGALAIETRMQDEAFEICGELNDESSWQAVMCERAVLAGLGGGCELPIGAYADMRGDTLDVMAVVMSCDGSRAVRARAAGARKAAEELGRRVAESLLAKGAHDILAESR